MLKCHVLTTRLTLVKLMMPPVDTNNHESKCLEINGKSMMSVGDRRRESRARALGVAGVAGLGALKARKTARAPMLMVGAWVRAHSIGRT